MEDPTPAADETILVVAPVFNESGCIEEVVESWLAALESHPGSEILLIDDGSTDGTWDKLKALAARHGAVQAFRKANEGHGPTVRRAYEEGVRTGHDWVFQTDSDAQFDPADLGLLWRRRGDSDFILGARRRRHDSYHRLVITRLVRLFNFCVFQTWIEDANVPFRLIRRAYLTKLLDVVPRDLFAPNIFLAMAAGERFAIVGSLAGRDALNYLGRPNPIMVPEALETEAFLREPIARGLVDGRLDRVLCGRELRDCTRRFGAARGPTSHAASFALSSGRVAGGDRSARAAQRERPSSRPLPRAVARASASPASISATVAASSRGRDS